MGDTVRDPSNVADEEDGGAKLLAFRGGEASGQPGKPGQGAFSRAVQAVYDAVTTTGRWGSALAAVAEMVDASAGLLVVGEPGGRPLVLALIGLDETLLDGERQPAAVTELGALLAEERVGAIVSRGHGPDGAAKPLGSAALNLLERSGLEDAIGVALAREGVIIANLWLFRHAGSPFPGAAAARLRQIVPHLQRAVTVQLRLERAEQWAAAAWQAFDRVVLGAVMVDENARPLLINRAARRIAARKDGFVIAEDGVAGVNPATTKALRAAVAEVARGRAKEGIGIRLERSGRARPYEVVVVPASRRRWWSLHHRPSAIVFVSDSARTGASLNGLIRDLYGLTAAESRLVLLLLGGQSLAEAAATLGTSRNTAHSQLTNIFRKTETTSQAELLRVLLQGPAAVRPPDESSAGSLPPAPEK